jgi:hypothetical protein
VITDNNNKPITGYALIIYEATNIRSRPVLDEIEEIMRQDIFHSTLDWQTRDQLHDAAREAVEILKEFS